MRRRDFIKAVAASVTASPLAAFAQQPATPVIGFLHGASSRPNAPMVAAFHQGLHGAGYVEGKNVAIEYRWADGRYDRLPALADDLIRRQVALLVAASNPAAEAIKGITTAIPIVFVIGIDPVKLGLVASLNEPGGNKTGTTIFTSLLAAKRLELLRTLLPNPTKIAHLLNPNNPSAKSDSQDVRDAAQALGQEIVVVHASTERELSAAFSDIVQQRVGAVLVNSDPFFDARREQLVALATQNAVPAIYPRREYVTAGGLMSYATPFADMYRNAGAYAGRILRGDKPANLPVLQPTRFELMINLKTARALGLNLPDKLLALADEVIE
jgi:putative ABC transport system substrate-binding protein